ncbi:tRNA lysidine(34) synthetase TilS [Candidatus Saccharibacteria bacterium]|nr:tRNA lysidine(34) synthetase TilS [Candidatus Saccharibacteria bacterium]
MKTIIAAISGGVDSITMLDLLSQAVEGKGAAGRAGFASSRPRDEGKPSVFPDIIVAHFNHGIREDSDEDEQLVKALAKQYGFKFESKKEILGAAASETYARQRRYKFLNDIANRYNGTIYTAHHADDVVETIALNLIRGTGWRGLVPLDSPNIERPLIGWWKADIRNYAKQHDLPWREDSTNLYGTHLRNRVRHALQGFTLQDKKQLLALYNQQKKLKRQIDTAKGELLTIRDREIFKQLDDNVALEILRAICTVQGVTPLRANLNMTLTAIRTFGTGKKFELNKYVTIKMNRHDFEVLYLTP